MKLKQTVVQIQVAYVFYIKSGPNFFPLGQLLIISRVANWVKGLGSGLPGRFFKYNFKRALAVCSIVERIESGLDRNIG